MDPQTGKAEGADDDEFRARKLEYEEWFEATKDGRAKAEKCRDYRNGVQYTQKELNTLKARGQPPIVDNQFADKCDALLGIERQMRTDPKAFPRTPSAEQDSEAATDALRFVADDNDFQRRVRSRACDNLIVEGMTSVEIVVEKRKGMKRPDVRVNHIRWDRAFWDVYALLPDFSDKRYCGFATWMDYEEAKRNPEWKDNLDALEQSESDAASDQRGDTNDDKPRFWMTVRKRKRVRIITHYYINKDDVWSRSVWCGGGYLEKPTKSAYLDEFGEPDCCIEMQSVYRDSDGNPYGPSFNWCDRQDEINKRKSKMLHLLNTKQVLAPRGAFPDDPHTGESGIKKARDELHKPDGFVEYIDGYGDKIQVRDNLQLAEGQYKMLEQAMASLQGTGPNAALLGNTGSVSGLAKQVDQQAGTLTVAPLFEALAALQLRIYRQMWMRVRQFWTAETWIRVTDDPENVKFVGLNRPIRMGELAAQKIGAMQMPDDQKHQMIMQVAQHPGAQQTATDPETGKPMLEHSVAEMDVDIIIDESPDVVTVQNEQFAMLAELAKTRQEIPFEVLLDLSQVRQGTKKRIMDKLTGQNDPEQAKAEQEKQQLAQAAAMLQLRREAAAAEKDEEAAKETAVDILIKTATFIEPQPQPAQKTQVSVN